MSPRADASGAGCRHREEDTDDDDAAGRPRRLLRLLGHVSFACDGIDVPLSAATQRLLALVAIEGRPVRRAVIAGRLWPEMTQHRAQANVRRALWRLPAPGGPLVEEHPGGLVLAPDIDVDIEERRRAVARLERGVLCVEAEIDALRTELLPGWSDEWTYPERERCRQDALHGLDAAAVAAAEQRRFALAVRTALTAIEVDPLRESSTRTLIRVHLLEGNLVDARRRYDAYLAQLVVAGLEPVVSEQTLRVVEPLLPPAARGAAARDAATPARRAGDTRDPRRGAPSS